MRFLFKWFFTLSIWTVLVITIITLYFAYDLPPIDKALEVSRRPSITILANDGSRLARFGDLMGDKVFVEDLPAHLINAFIATEDRRFYSHFGVDVVGIVRAMVSNLKAGHIVQGGSTITQQAAKNLFLNSERTFKRKYQELILALWLEQKFTKDQIMSIYLNRVYFGSGSYGVDSASRTYFGKEAKKLTVLESAIIAGIVKAPSRLNPAHNPKGAIDRAKVVISNMVKSGYLNEIQAKQLIESKFRYKQHRKSKKIGQYFTDWVSDQIRGFAGPNTSNVIVRTTLNPLLQIKLELILEKYLSKYGKKLKVSQGASILMTSHGAILAMAGGRDYNKSQFNRATQALRQPGSAFKPIVYLAGLEAGLKPDTKFVDSRVSVEGWSPKNYNNKFIGELSLKSALAKSVNTIAVQVSEYAGRDEVIKTARQLGIVSPLTRSPSLALGTSELSLFELTSAYAVFANGGRGVLPFGILQIEDNIGNVIYKRSGGGTGQIVDQNNVSLMNEMLKEVVISGTGRNARFSGQEKGKTGTSQRFRDAWFVGYVNNLVGGVWVGNDNDGSMKKVVGGGLPSFIWRDFMRYAQNQINKLELEQNTRPIKIQKEKSFWNKFIDIIIPNN
ncbi:MAG: hypothetical protein CMM67_08870 [Rhodospirillaceae bacterium]|nr:hypothetical protein [Rhodospirillaceae bacterium]OUT77328.1 MAG: hypothetical protein CBB83_09050 [Rhodospirillaceae bacterium TMED23]